jgi:uncharacterized protein YndB with AHSA1/START domain
MTATLTQDAHGVLTEPATLTLERVLPGPIERVWAYLTDGDLRRQWLAAGPMEPVADAPFELVWRNDELSDPPGRRPDGFAAEHRMQSRVLAAEPPRRLVITWGREGEVAFDLTARGQDVLLTLVHRRLPDRDTMLNVAASWPAHLGILAAKLHDEAPAPFWDTWTALRQDYDRRLPA